MAASEGMSGKLIGNGKFVNCFLLCDRDSEEENTG